MSELEQGVAGRRTVLKYASSVVIAGMATPSILRAQGSTTRATLSIHYLPRGDYAPYYLAKERGYYAEKGLDLTIKHVIGNALAFQALSAGQAQFVHADMTQMLQLQITQPSPAMCSVAIAIDRCPMTLFYLADRSIVGPKDLEGRTIIDSAGANTPNLIKSFESANDVDGSKIAWKIAAPSAKVALMLQGQADFVATDYQAKAGIEAKLKPDQRLGGFRVRPDGREHGGRRAGDDAGLYRLQQASGGRFRAGHDPRLSRIPSQSAGRRRRHRQASAGTQPR